MFKTEKGRSVTKVTNLYREIRNQQARETKITRERGPHKYNENNKSSENNKSRKQKTKITNV